MRLTAHAKVNLTLAVGPPIAAGEPNAGYHPIASLMHAIDLADTVEVERGEGFAVEWSPDAPLRSPIDWPRERDLAFRAHRALEAHVGRMLPTRIRIVKRIPVGGGLGGGSSDAAAALRGINGLFDLRLDHAALATVGRTLGSDVPFFLDPPPSPSAPPSAQPPRPAMVTGVADSFARLPRRDGWLVLALPRFGCPTREVYQAFDSLVRGPLRSDEAAAVAGNSAWPPTRLFNDLLPAAELIRPELGVLRHGLDAALRQAWHLSGSGSTLFLPVVTSAAAHTIASKMGRDLPDAVYVPARLA
ncbi:MAG: 4-(cytidine 5'-diphospho)-2-C-methyl-D-erythritol kinase [Phycisphaerales bacterium]